MAELHLHSLDAENGSSEDCPDAATWRSLVDAKERILANPEWANVPVPGTGCGDPHIGSARIPLGGLLELWSAPDSPWVRTCPHCGGKLYMTFINGSCLSGGRYCTGFCLSCHLGNITQNDVPYLAAIDSGVKMARKYALEHRAWLETHYGLPPLEKTRRARFSDWDTGLPERIEVLRQRKETEARCPAPLTLHDVLFALDAGR